MQEQLAEIAAIVESAEAPTFENTIEVLERTGRTLVRVNRVFSGLNSAHTNDELQALAKEINPRLARQRDDIMLNAELFARVKTVHEGSGRSSSELSTEQAQAPGRDLQERSFAGAPTWKEDSQDAAAGASTRNSRASRPSSARNLLKEMNAIALLIENEDRSRGPTRFRPGRRRRDRGGSQGHARQVGIHPPADELDAVPPVRGAPRPAREALRAPTRTWATTTTSTTTRPSLREDRGPAGRTLENPRLRDPRRLRAREEHGRASGAGQRAARQALETGPGQGQDGTRRAPGHDRGGRGATDRAGIAWELVVLLREGSPAPSTSSTSRPSRTLPGTGQRPPGRLRRCGTSCSASSFEDTEPTSPSITRTCRPTRSRTADGSLTSALYYVDYFTRESKRGRRLDEQLPGAVEGGRQPRSGPSSYNVCNFSKPTEGQPALLSLDEARTLFHEFGHALHGMLANGTYESLSGTNVVARLRRASRRR